MKLSSPAAERNRAAIANAMAGWLPPSGLVLEVASGTGEHAAHFARAFPGSRWQPSDPDPQAWASIEAWRAEVGLRNLLPPIGLDASEADWPIDRADAVLCINMVHISPWEATLGLLRGAARLLGTGGPLILYGPYRQAGVPTAPTNEAFDMSLKARNHVWGLRSIDQVAEAAAPAFALAEIVSMPANNLCLLFRKADIAAA